MNPHLFPDGIWARPEHHTGYTVGRVCNPFTGRAMPRRWWWRVHGGAAGLASSRELAMERASREMVLARSVTATINDRED